MNTNNTHNIPPDEQPMLPFDPPIEFEPSITTVPQTPDVAALIAENESLKRAARERDARDQISALLRSAGARSPELMVEAAKGDLQFADGSLANAEALVSQLKAKFPEQFWLIRPTTDHRRRRGLASGVGNTHKGNARPHETGGYLSPQLGRRSASPRFVNRES